MKSIVQKFANIDLKKDLRLSSIKCLGLLLGFTLQVFFTKIIGVQEYGLYTLFITWINFLSLLLILGYDRVIIKQVSYFYIQGMTGKFRSTLDKLIIFVLINGLIFLVIAFFIPQPVLANSFFSKDLLRSSWLLIAIGTVTYTLFDLSSKILSSIQKVELTILSSEVIYKFILFVTAILLLYYFRTETGINIIVVAVILAHILTLITVLILSGKKKVQGYLNIKKEKITLGKENYVFFFTGFNYYVINQIDKIFLGKYESLETLGVYGLVTTLIGIMSFSTIVYQRFLPKISNYFRTDNIKGLEKDFKTTCRNSILIALPFMMFILVDTNDILLFFGEKYTSGTVILRVLIWGQMMNFLTGPCGNLLIHGKHAKADLINSIIVVGLTIALVFAGYRYYGVIGVAAATSFGMTLINIVKVIEVKVFYKIFPYEFKNIILTVMVFMSFYFVKLFNLNISNLVIRLIVNFSLSLIISVVLIAIIYFLKAKKYSYKTMLLNFNNTGK